MIWKNFIVPSKFSYLSEGHLDAETLASAIENGNFPETSYYCAFDLEPRDTFKTYKGKARPALGYVNFDFDHETHPEFARSDAVNFISDLGIKHPKIFFSGSKGFHVCVHESAFKDLAHDEHLPSKLHAIAIQLKLKYTTLDTSVYHYSRKFRVPGSKHENTGLYKIQISHEQLLTLSVDEIKSHAKENTLASLSIDGKEEILFKTPDLKKLRKYQNGELDQQFDRKEKFSEKKCIETILNTQIKEGERHRTSLILLCEMYKTEVPEEDAKDRILKWCDLVGFEGKRIDDTLATLENIYAGNIYYSFGCSDPMKASFCTTACKLNPRYIVEENKEKEKMFDVFIPEELRDDKNKNPMDHSLFFEKYLKDKVLYDESEFRWYQYNWIWEVVGEKHTEKFILSLVENNYTTPSSAAFFTNLVKFIKIKLSRSPIMDRIKGYPKDVWNDNRDLLPMNNGILNLKTKELIPHSPEQMMNWFVPYNYNPEAECPTFLRFMGNMCQGDKVAEALAVAFLWCILVGRSDLQKYLEIIGKPGTGKSTYLHVATGLVGAQNTAITSMKELSMNRFETSNLRGKRLTLITDSDAWAGSVEVLKALTGRDPIRNEEKNVQQKTGFVYGGMVIIAGNSPIQFNDPSTALARRRLTINLDQFLSDDKREDNFLEKLQSEMPGILNFLLSSGDQHYINIITDKQRDRVGTEARSLTETDSVAAWLDENTISSPDAHEKIGVIERDGQSIVDANDKLYPNFVAFSESTQRYSKITQQTFSTRVLEIMKLHGYSIGKVRKTDGMYLTGVRLRKDRDFNTVRPISKLKFFD